MHDELIPLSVREIKAPVSQLSRDELRRPAQYTARCMVHAYVTNVMTLVRQGITDDRHSLHDLRVALRRLRVWLDAYWFSLQDTCPKGTRQKLHRIQASTNAARDLEVQYDWLRKQMQHDTTLRRQRSGKRSLLRRYRKDLRHAGSTIRRTLPRIARRIDKASSYYCVAVDGDRGKDFSMALATVHALTASAHLLRQRVVHVTSAEDVKHIHRARVAAKRLRYVLDPLRDTCQAAQRAIGRLTDLQDRMGELRDASVLHDRLLQSGRSALVQRACERLDAARAQYEMADVRTTVDRILIDVSRVVVMLHAVSGESLHSPDRPAPHAALTNIQ